MCSCILHQLYSKWSKSSSSLFSSDRPVQIVWHFQDSLCTKQQHFALSSAPAHPFFTASKSQRGTWKQSLNKYGFICDAIFFTFMHEHKAITKEAYSLLKFIKLEIVFVCTNRCLGQRFFSPYCILLLIIQHSTSKDTYRYHSLSKLRPPFCTLLWDKSGEGVQQNQRRQMHPTDRHTCSEINFEVMMFCAWMECSQ